MEINKHGVFIDPEEIELINDSKLTIIISIGEHENKRS
jgi:hypothetical protein